MKVSELAPGVLLLEGVKHADHRGWYTEAFNRETFRAATGLDVDWGQDSLFHSKAGALRGPHFCTSDVGQYKLVSCLKGVLFDAAICVDRDSPVYGSAVRVTLTEGDSQALLIPPGYAHAALALDDCLVSYKTNVGQAPGKQFALKWDDPEINVGWPRIPTLMVEAEPRIYLKEATYRV